MALTLFNKDLNIISVLDTEPNDVGGLSADEFKAKFDEAGLAIQDFINKTLIPEIASDIDAAAQGVSSGSNIDGSKITDGSIYANKLADLIISTAKIIDAAVTSSKIANGAVTRAKLAADATTLQTEDFSNKVVPTRALSDNCVTSVKMADEAVTSAKIAPGAVSAEKLAPNAVSISVSVVLPASGWSNNMQTISVEAAAEDNTVFISPEPSADNYEAYTGSGVRCVAQGSNILTFMCDTVPGADLTVNVTVINK